jgi:glycosyltransferase involved in cell wall biosynthesis
MTHPGQRPKLIHLTTVDMTLELLLGPQLEAFAEAGYDVIGVSAPGPFVERIEARGVRHIPLTSSTRDMSIAADLKSAAEFAGIVRRERPEIVHTHNPKPGVYGRVVARALRVPAVVNTTHGLYATPDDPLPKRAVVYGLERIAASFSHAELLQNPEDLPVLRSLRIAQRKLTVFGNGVDLNRFRPQPEVRAAVRHELGLAEDAVVIGAVGRLVFEKGYAELFAAWPGVRAAVPNAELLVIGGADPEKSDALDQAALDAAAAAGVRLLGMRSDVERLYQAMDVYVLASYREGFPRSAMEAAACGLPLVATNIRGCRQVIEDGVTGRLVPARAVAPLQEALIESASADVRAGWGAASLRKARAEFDQQHQIDTSLRIYRELLGSRAPA